MSTPSTIQISLGTKIKDRLQALAKSKNCSEADVAAEAIAAYLDHQAWIASEIEQGVKEAEAGDFATPEDAEAVFDKWTS